MLVGVEHKRARQRTEEWFRLRASCVLTASQFGDAVGVGRGRPIHFLQSLRQARLDETWSRQQQQQQQRPTPAMQHGIDLEPTIASMYQFLSGNEVTACTIFTPAPQDVLFGLVAASPGEIACDLRAQTNTHAHTRARTHTTNKHTCTHTRAHTHHTHYTHAHTHRDYTTHMQAETLSWVGGSSNARLFLHFEVAWMATHSLAFDVVCALQMGKWFKTVGLWGWLNSRPLFIKCTPWSPTLRSGSHEATFVRSW